MAGANEVEAVAATHALFERICAKLDLA